MRAPAYPHLLSPLQIGPVRLRNRMVFTAHDSLLEDAGFITDRYIAYQVARTRGGAGLQILAAANVMEGCGTFEFQPRLDTDVAIPGYRALAQAVHAEGGVVFAQLLHAGREQYSSADGSLPLAYAPSATRSERSRIVPRELSRQQIAEIVEAYGLAAARAVEAGMDGVEICGNQGNLPAQFLTATINHRRDEYGGSPENRRRFLMEVCASVRRQVGDRVACGVRLSVADLDNLGLTEDEGLDALQHLDRSGLVDYLHVVLGTGASRAGAYHIVPPMSSPTGYTAPFAAKVKSLVSVPVIATGRFNAPQAAEDAISGGSADAVGMTRAMICDPELGRKVSENRIDDVRACIACDQACIGHLQKGYPVSCIQFPEAGRELTLGRYGPAVRPRSILVAGGGPAGMKAAAVLASRGHRVTLCEAGAQLGGQAVLAAQLPGRAEFGGIVTNLAREMELAGVDVRLRSRVDRAFIEAAAPEAVVIATGGRPARPMGDYLEARGLVSAQDILAGRAEARGRVVIADAVGDWVGLGLALHLARNGHAVTLALTGLHPGENTPPYVRDEGGARLFEAGVEIIPSARLFGLEGDTAYFEHVMALKPIVLEGVDTLVACFGAEADRTLEAELSGLAVQLEIIGDCLAPRTAEEAVLDALKVAVRL